MRKPRTLRGRIALWYAGMLALVLLAMTAVAYNFAGENDDTPEVRALEGPDEAPEQVLLALGMGLPVALLIAAAGGLWIGRRALSPIDDVVRIASSMDADRLGDRMTVDRGAGEEVERLVAAFNGMLERIERSVNGVRRFTADASHELRTPLAILRGELEVDLRRPREPAEMRATMERSLEELERMSRLVENLLVLARRDAGQLRLEKEPVDVAELAQRVASDLAPLATARKIAITSTVAPGTWITADPLWAGRVLANLVENACKFAAPGGKVTIAASRNADVIETWVDDDGPGIAAADRERVFERFFRVEALRSAADGSGLGLALARELARAQGGDLHAEASPLGGARMRLDLPSVPI